MTEDGRIQSWFSRLQSSWGDREKAENLYIEQAFEILKKQGYGAFIEYLDEGKWRMVQRKVNKRHHTYFPDAEACAMQDLITANTFRMEANHVRGIHGKVEREMIEMQLRTILKGKYTPAQTGEIPEPDEHEQKRLWRDKMRETAHNVVRYTNNREK